MPSVRIVQSMILTSCLILALCTFQFSAEPCALEHDTDYYGNEDTTPDGRPKCSSTANKICAQRDTIPDVPSCQSYCNSSTYFTWKAPKKECFCKSSDSGRRPSEMDVSGKTNCVGERQVLWHSDGRCGMQYPLWDGSPGQCDPGSDAVGQGPCCSKIGWCGNQEFHCHCSECVDYRTTGSLTVPTSSHPMAECCDRVSVEFDEKNAAYEAHPGTYTEYLKDGTHNGRVTYTSIDNRFAITFIGGKWWIQNLSSR